jgi:hypothetical protein
MQEQTESIKLKIQRTLQLGRALRFVWQSAKGWTPALSYEAHGRRRDRGAGGSRQRNRF